MSEECAPPGGPQRTTGSGANGPVRWLSRHADRLGAWSLLAIVLGLVLAANVDHFSRNPFPPRSQHRAFMMVPRLLRHFQGYRPRPAVVDHMDPSGKGYALPYRTPIPWGKPTELLEEFKPGGRLYMLVGKCSAGFFTCMPHSFSVLAAIGALLPGEAMLTTLGITYYFLLLLLAAYGIGSELGGRWTGVAAAAISASYPGLYGFSRWIEGYLPATALSVAMVYCLIRSRGLTRILPCVLFTLMAFMAIRNGEGLSEGIGAGLAVSGPFVLALVHGIYTSIKARRVPFRTVLGATLIVVPLALTMDYAWLFNSLHHVDDGFDEWYQNIRPGDPNATLTMKYIFAYGGYLILTYTKYLKPLMFLWLVLSLPLFLLRSVRYKATLILWFLVPLVACSIMPRKALWYALPIVPPLALITAAGLSAIRARWLKTTAMMLVCVTGLAQMLAFSTPGVFTLMPLPIWLRDPVRRDFLWARQCELVGPNRPDMVNLKESTDRFLAYLDEHVPRSSRLKLVAAVSNWGEDIYYGQAFAYQVNLSRPDIEVIPLAEPHFIDIEPYSGLRPEYFAFYVRFVNGKFAPCCDGSGRAVLADRDQGHQAPPPFERFVRKLLRRYVGRVPEMPNVLVLDHAEVAHLDVLP